MMTVKEVCKLTGVSVRTLHHYDKIGLLKPIDVTDSGYRLYDNTSLIRLQSILLFKELQFSLKEIKTILDNPSFEPFVAIDEQIKLLEMKRKKLDSVISLARKIKCEGANNMNFDAFDNSQFDKYKEEAKQKWGNTKEYKEYQAKQTDKKEAGKKLMQIFASFGSIKEKAPYSDDAQKKVAELQNFISKNFYSCSKEILNSLGEMYVKDERFKQNIDNAGGIGTATFVKEAINYYCSI